MVRPKRIDFYPTVFREIRIKISVKNILQRKGFRGDVGRAHSMVLYLLHERLPRRYTELASYLGLKNKSRIDYKMRRVKNSKDLQEILGKIL